METHFARPRIEGWGAEMAEQGCRRKRHVAHREMRDEVRGSQDTLAQISKIVNRLLDGTSFERVAGPFGKLPSTGSGQAGQAFERSGSHEIIDRQPRKHFKFLVRIGTRTINPLLASAKNGAPACGTRQ